MEKKGLKGKIVFAAVGFGVGWEGATGKVILRNIFVISRQL